MSGGRGGGGVKGGRGGGVDGVLEGGRESLEIECSSSGCCRDGKGFVGAGVRRRWNADDKVIPCSCSLRQSGSGYLHGDFATP